jgi:hypothetical protein
VDREQMDEFYAVQEAVYDGLRLGRYIDRHRSVPVCQYLVLPAFENPVSWDVIRVVSRTAGAQTRLYRSCWRMDLDDRAMSSPVERLKHPRPFKPTVEVDWVLVELARVEELVARFRSVRVPLAVARSHSGCDGVSFELSVGEFFCNARIGWWCDLPDEWLELQPVVSDVAQLFERAWAARAEAGAAADGGGM